MELFAKSAHRCDAPFLASVRSGDTWRSFPHPHRSLAQHSSDVQRLVLARWCSCRSADQTKMQLLDRPPSVRAAIPGNLLPAVLVLTAAALPSTRRCSLSMMTVRPARPQPIAH